jgi:hypothetical protein
VPGAGHWLQQERAQLTNAALVEFARATRKLVGPPFPPAAAAHKLYPQFA